MDLVLHPIKEIKPNGSYYHSVEFTSNFNLICTTTKGIELRLSNGPLKGSVKMPKGWVDVKKRGNSLIVLKQVDTAMILLSYSLQNLSLEPEDLARYEDKSLSMPHIPLSTEHIATISTSTLTLRLYDFTGQEKAIHSLKDLVQHPCGFCYTSDNCILIGNCIASGVCNKITVN